MIGAKTGTGDHSRKTSLRPPRRQPGRQPHRHGRLLARDNLLGTVTIHVSGPHSADFAFTGSLPAHLLKALAPTIQPLLNERSLRTAEAADPDEGV